MHKCEILSYLDFPLAAQMTPTAAASIDHVDWLSVEANRSIELNAVLRAWYLC
jgi:hypothetical protein